MAGWRVRQGVPCRDAHEIAGACVRRWEAAGIELWGLTDADVMGISAHLAPEVRLVLAVDGALAARSAKGGTAPARVADQLGAARSAASAARRWLAVGSHG